MNTIKKFIAGSATVALSSLAFTSVVLAETYDTWEWEADTAEAGLFGATGFVLVMIYCCLGLCSLLIPVGFAIWVYRDAQKNNVDNAILWAILTFFFTLIGLLIYLLAIRPDAIKKQEESKSKKEDKVIEKN